MKNEHANKPNNYPQFPIKEIDAVLCEFEELKSKTPKQVFDSESQWNESTDYIPCSSASRSIEFFHFKIRQALNGGQINSNQILWELFKFWSLQKIDIVIDLLINEWADIDFDSEFTNWIINCFTSVDYSRIRWIISIAEKKGINIDYQWLSEYFEDWLSLCFINFWLLSSLPLLTSLVQKKNIGINLSRIYEKWITDLFNTWEVSPYMWIMNISAELGIKINYQNLSWAFSQGLINSLWNWWSVNFTPLITSQIKRYCMRVDYDEIFTKWVAHCLKKASWHSTIYQIESEGKEIEGKKVVIDYKSLAWDFSKALIVCLRNWDFQDFDLLSGIVKEKEISVDFQQIFIQGITLQFTWLKIYPVEINDVISKAKKVGINIDLSEIFRNLIEDKKFMIALRILKFAIESKYINKDHISSKEITDAIQCARQELESEKNEVLPEMIEGQNNTIKNLI